MCVCECMHISLYGIWQSFPLFRLLVFSSYTLLHCFCHLLSDICSHVHRAYLHKCCVTPTPLEYDRPYSGKVQYPFVWNGSWTCCHKFGLTTIEQLTPDWSQSAQNSFITHTLTLASRATFLFAKCTPFTTFRGHINVFRPTTP